MNAPSAAPPNERLSQDQQQQPKGGKPFAVVFVIVSFSLICYFCLFDPSYHTSWPNAAKWVIIVSFLITVGITVLYNTGTCLKSYKATKDPDFSIPQH